MFIRVITDACHKVLENIKNNNGVQYGENVVKNVLC